MSRSAWLLTLVGGIRVAVGIPWMREVISDLDRDLYPVFAVPLMAEHCRYLMPWRTLLIPVLHLETLLETGETTLIETSALSRIVVAISPQADEKVLNYGVLPCSALPVQISVSASQQCDYPHPRWTKYASSCFDHQGHAVPILDTGKVFSAAMPELK